MQFRTDRSVIAAGLWLATVSVLPAAGDAPAMLRSSCGDCHIGEEAEGGFDVDRLLRASAAAGAVPRFDEHPHQREWVSVWKNLRSEMMPPADHSPRPTAADRRLLLDWIEREVFRLERAAAEPGEPVLRRLNRVEYVNAVRDLTGITLDVTGELPPDDTGHGFDTIGEVLTVSPLLVERYLSLAEQVGDRILADLRSHRDKSKNKAGVPAHLRPVFGTEGPPETADAADEYLRRTIERFGRRGFRRPLDEASRDRLLAVADAARNGPQGTSEDGIVAAVTAMLAAPRFLFRDERPATVSSAVAPVDEFTLASRLSFFLWSTIPDDELLDLAAEGRLRAELSRQLDRMIKDRRSDALGSHFVGQWLQTRDVETLAFDVRKILGLADREAAEKIFNADVRRAMRQETEMLFLHLLREDRPATDLLVGRETFVNEPLAAFYGISDVQGKEMRLVQLAEDSHRHGLLTHASLLMVTSNPTRTSPVKRGLFILDNLLGTPPPPPPPDVPALEASVRRQEKPQTMRELMELHRRDSLCASCHARMDPLGLALEEYDALGRWRGEAAAGLDPSGMLITGETFSDVATLAARIAGARQADFYRCLTEKLLTYALGRGIEYFDAPAVDTIVAESLAGGGMQTFIRGVVESVPFQMIRVKDRKHED